MSADDALLHCAQELRQQDPDRYLVCTLLPPAGRRIALALFALDLELARIRDAVSEPMLGEMRLQFWRDTLTGVAGGEVRAHPVAQALAAAMAKETVAKDMPLAGLLGLVDARARDLDETPMTDLAELSAYASATAGALNVVLLSTLGIDDPDAAAAVRAAGTGWVLVGFMQALPRHLARRRMPIPEEILNRHNVDREATFAAHFTPELGRAVNDVIAEAERHLSTVGQTLLPKAARPVLAAVPLARRDARALRRVGCSPFDLKPPGPLARQLTVGLSVLAARLKT
ncbi:MAG: squalene/phytoene synthase family protein [Alphaproteobacteria bacterium]|nr:squalene/phytoene synthase family protein [Alphaproteobacteria bacterium]